MWFPGANRTTRCHWLLTAASRSPSNLLDPSCLLGCRHTVAHRLALTGRAETTPWDEPLQTVMIATDVAVHEEAIVDLLLADL